MNDVPSLPCVGWREWAALPDLGIPAIKAKLDTGARTSTLHAFDIEPFRDGGAKHVRFGVHPLRRRPEIVLHCSAEVSDERTITDSGGHKTRRPVIVTTIALGDALFPMEVTLHNREQLLFRLLLGRTALAERFLVDSSRGYTLGRGGARAYRKGPKPIPPP